LDQPGPGSTRSATATAELVASVTGAALVALVAQVAQVAPVVLVVPVVPAAVQKAATTAVIVTEADDIAAGSTREVRVTAATRTRVTT